MLVTVCVAAGVAAIAWMTHRVIRASRAVDEILRDELDPPEEHPPEQEPPDHTA